MIQTKEERARSDNITNVGVWAVPGGILCANSPLPRIEEAILFAHDALRGINHHPVLRAQEGAQFFEEGGSEEEGALTQGVQLNI